MASILCSPFKLALIQLGSTGKDKAANLVHAREMVLKAAKGRATTPSSSSAVKPDLVVLPV